MDTKKVIQSPKIAISESAEGVLVEAFEKVNTGFLGGKISKLDLASWALMDSLEKLTETKIESIRKPFFNEICYLESVVKMTKQNGLDKLTAEQVATIQSLFSGKPEKARTKAQKESESDSLFKEVAQS
jgi:hypothetical protein